MTEQERIFQIEHSLADLERQLFNLKFEVKELKNTRQTAAVTPTVSDIPVAETNDVTASTTVPVTSPTVSAASVPENAASQPAPVPAPASTTAKKPVQPQSTVTDQRKDGKVKG